MDVPNSTKRKSSFVLLLPNNIRQMKSGETTLSTVKQRREVRRILGVEGIAKERLNGNYVATVSSPRVFSEARDAKYRTSASESCFKLSSAGIIVR